MYTTNQVHPLLVLFFILILVFFLGIVLYNPAPTPVPLRNVIADPYIRVSHAIPNGPNVDVYVNGALTFQNVAYGTITNYASTLGNNFLIQVFPVGSRVNPLVEKTVALNTNDSYTVVIFPNAANNTQPDFNVYYDNFNTMIQGNNSRIRFGHFVPNAPAVDVVIPGGAVLFRNVSYGQITDYAEVASNTYNIDIRPAGSGNSAVSIQSVMLLPGTWSSAFAQGYLANQVTPAVVRVVQDVPYNQQRSNYPTMLY